VAGRFPLLTDNHVRQSIIQALRSRGWDVLRAVDRFGERNDDEEPLAWATTNDRALATCDEPIHRIARRWIDEGRSFRMVFWWLERYRQMTDSDMVVAFEEIAAKPNAFAYPIEYIKPTG
jgi:hypothetical protein